MTKKSTTNNNLPIAIAFAAIVIAGAIFFNGMKAPAKTAAPTGDLDAKIAAGIEGYIKKQQEAERKAREEANKPKKVEGVTTGGNAMIGNPDAKVTIVEFSDYECPFCKRHHANVWPELKKKYIDTGKVNYVFRDLPLPFHEPKATEEAVAAECAGKLGGDAKYYEYHDALFANTGSNGKGIGDKTYADLAEEIGLDTAKFEECLKDDSIKEEVKKDMADGAKYGVSGTPGFFINGWFIKGAYPFSEFEKFIEQELKAAK